MVSQLGEAAIQHGARHHADVLAELGAHQDDGGGRWQGGLAGAVGAGHRLPLRACYPDTCAPSWNSFQVMPSCSALNDASMRLVEQPMVVQIGSASGRDRWCQYV